MPPSANDAKAIAEGMDWHDWLTASTHLCITTLNNDASALWVQLDRVRNNPQTFAHDWPQVIVALATLQHSVQDLSRAYIQHANTVLAPGKQGLTPIDANLTNILTESGLLTGRPAEAAPVAIEAETDGKKKRKRTPHDPNAPKRALTPYFLYMQSARATIAKELGDSAKPKEVADEGTRRWTEMNPGEKSVSIPHVVPYIIVADCLLGLGRQVSRELGGLQSQDGGLQSWSTCARRRDGQQIGRYGKQSRPRRRR